ncbi:deoxyribonucleoside regulator [Cryobacterium psychrotolerans]|uniref:Deoxyribonucleoside regulator n=1 Tax=Cryobacterium psychrotolerans TaxID=386301 RepID=A0A1G8YQP0_9MICO|nr:sugar-binding domain-containing protein [Cryobacterium psychrotolerans]TFD85629.1 sugar-binding transcriptional regulator [Cryobacterium psychrotolerans]SDK05066.1 deoxyribonucleoside regulator [Cryobacterium psychrotolerans]
MINTDELMSIRAAELYYEENKTQDEIGSILRLTRWKVGRLLAQAKASGFIRIEIVHPRARRLPVERRLRESTGLTDAIVVSSVGVANDEELQSRTAQAAADYLTGLRPIPRTLGISWGRTLHDVSLHLKHGWAPGVDVVQINGGVSLNKRAGTAATTAVTIAHKAFGAATLLPSPAILERLETKQAIESDRAVAAVLEQAAGASAYLYSAGQADAHSALVDSGYLSPDEVAELVRRGAVGDIVGRYIDKNGDIVDSELDERTLGIQLEQLRRATLAIAVISGGAKHAVARAIVGSGLCTVLVTDEDTARALLGDDV